jgi:hypothetical protein
MSCAICRICGENNTADTDSRSDMRIDILSSTHPDMGTETSIYIDGERVTDVNVVNIDPGAGYDIEDIEQRLKDAQEQAAKPDATDFDKDVAEALKDYDEQFRKFASSND